MGDVAALAGFDRGSERSGQFRFADDHSADQHAAIHESGSHEPDSSGGDRASADRDPGRTSRCTITLCATKYATVDEDTFPKRFPIGDECA